MEENYNISSNFIHDIIDEELASGKNTRVQTRFPPEPNGYLHIGHAKAIFINFETAKKYKGICNLRMDDTNPSKEEIEYVESMKADIEWLGYKWDNFYFASSYFDFIHECAVKLIKKGKAYVDDLSAEEISLYRGTLTEAGKNSPYRERSIDENLDLFERMTKGEFPNGAKVLRAKIDMSSPNINMRDPVIYRIAHVSHHQTGDKWCVYPLYDFAHPLSDAAENVTYSLCSLEFENHRPLYDWCINEIGFNEPPRQIEFARLNLNYCITSKRRCLALINNNKVDGWDDPRMATLSGMRRRGYPSSAIRDFIEKVGVSKAYSIVDYGLLESCVRDALNANAPRTMCVMEPLKVVIENYPEGKSEKLTVEIHPEHPEMGTTEVDFSREIFVEKSDFMIEPPKKYYRLFVGNEVRLKGAYFITVNRYDTDENGEVTCLYATYDPQSRGGNSPDGRKVRGTIHFVDASANIKAQLNLYDRLFTVENPSAAPEVCDVVNPESLIVLKNCLLDASVKNLSPGDTFQFMRQGYFCVDKNSTHDNLIFNRTVELNSSWKA